VVGGGRRAEVPSRRAREQGGGSEVACSGGRRPGGVFGGTGRRKMGRNRLAAFLLVTMACGAVHGFEAEGGGERCSLQVGPDLRDMGGDRTSSFLVLSEANFNY